MSNAQNEIKQPNKGKIDLLNARSKTDIMFPNIGSNYGSEVTNLNVRFYKKQDVNFSVSLYSVNNTFFFLQFLTSFICFLPFVPQTSKTGRREVFIFEKWKYFQKWQKQILRQVSETINGPKSRYTSLGMVLWHHVQRYSLGI